MRRNRMMKINKMQGQGWYIDLRRDDFDEFLPIIELLGDMVLDEHSLAIKDIVGYFKAGNRNKYITDEYKNQLIPLLDIADLPYEIYENT
jgi:hypothetical protein